jgi:hypothetical protein
LSGVLSPFNADGVLPPGDHVLTLDELQTSRLVEPEAVAPEGDTATREGEERPWDRDYRLKLVNNLRPLISDLVKVGISEVFIDGSFVSDKPKPRDIDGYFVVKNPREWLKQSAELANINRRVWTWDPKSATPDFQTGKPKLPMWHSHKVELFPHWPGVMSGIKDEFGNPQEYPAAFRKTRELMGGKRVAKGIVKLNLGGTP